MKYKFDPRSKKEGLIFLNHFWSLGHTRAISPKFFENRCREFLFIEDKRILHSPRNSFMSFEKFKHTEILILKPNKLNKKLYSEILYLEKDYMIVEKK